MPILDPHERKRAGRRKRAAYISVSEDEAKTYLDDLIEQVLGGHKVVITRGTEPVVRLVREKAGGVAA
ncbi:MAG: hypothetical protein JWN21_204 [Sphingomonas bacterium]|uniref:type II toxin-antitoxin system Phd/YefM family antitoxin n=1 Tax=Sphingomonas bacterium TaxID=1895847 RepID=UPI002635A321|nr:hypothetical protein [Sphingomonas bacterium]MDB5694661.1 hypothetical protein [Sphingomonas bacterium]